MAVAASTPLPPAVLAARCAAASLELSRVCRRRHRASVGASRDRWVPLSFRSPQFSPTNNNTAVIVEDRQSCLSVQTRLSVLHGGKYGRSQGYKARVDRGDVRSGP